MNSFIQFVLSIASTFLRAFVVHLSWGWFILPATGVASPGIFVVMGLLLIIGLVFGVEPSYLHKLYRKEVDDGFPLFSVMVSLILTLIMWLILFLVHLAV